MFKPLFFALFTLLSLGACSKVDVARLMEQYMWEKEVILLFTPSAQHATFQQQRAILESAKRRDQVIWFIIADERVIVDGATKPQLGTPAFYQHFNVHKARYTLIALGKDGNETMRRTTLVQADAFTQP